jgi:Bacterial SH3 domain
MRKVTRGAMRGSIPYFLPLVSLWFAFPAFAADTHYLKCAVNQERVWVYESLNSFDVEARLKCGEPVEILSRVKGFVKIRTTNGVEGYVPDTAFSDLPPLPDDANPVTAASAANPLVAASAAARGALSSGTPTGPSAVTVKAAAPIIAPPKEVPKEVLPPPLAPVASTPAVSAGTPVAAHPSPKKAAVPAKAVPPVNAAPPPAPTSARISTASVLSKPTSPSTSAHSTTSASNSSAPPAKPAAPVATVAPVSARMPDSSVPAASSAGLAAMQPATEADVDSEDYPDAKPENESADPSCRLFFTAYGLAPSQYKWLAENRRKEHASICPAPDLSRVDYVILFTHDSDTYSVAMPTAVHTDRNGFSDFNPMTTVDTALMPSSEVEKARYEFVWVFRVKRGDFDPTRFSQRRRPQFTTYVKGSHAPARAVEDAFGFIQEQSPTR